MNNKLFDHIVNTKGIVSVELTSQLTVFGACVHFEDSEAAKLFVYEFCDMLIADALYKVFKGHIGNVYINITNPNVYKVYLCTSGAGVIGYNIDRKLLSIVEDKLYTWPTADYVSKESDIDSAVYQIIPSSFNVPSDYGWAVMSAVSTKNRYYTIINSQAFSVFSTIIANHIRKIKTIG